MRFRAPMILLAAALAIPHVTTAAVVRVPQDQPSIAAAIGAAAPGDSILVGPGRWCGTVVTKQVHLEGEGGAAIIGCPTNPKISDGTYTYLIGLALTAGATGSTIHGLVFDGTGFVDVYKPTTLGIGIASHAANDVAVLENAFLGGLIGVNALASGWTISHNVFSGFSLSRSNLGGLAINASNPYGGQTRLTGTRIEFNYIESTVPPGDWSAARLIGELDLPFAGIFLEGQDGAVVSHNIVRIQANERGEPGAGIVATDEVTGVSDTNERITLNDGRDCAYVVVVSGTGGRNTSGAVIQMNLGRSLVEGTLSSFGVPGGH